MMPARRLLAAVWGMLDFDQRAELLKTPEDREREEQHRRVQVITAAGGEVG